MNEINYPSKEGNFEWLECDDLVVHHSEDGGYQRKNKKMGDKISLEGWRWQLGGTLTVFHRKRSGMYAVVDGGGRLLGAIGLNMTRLPCMVYESTGPQEEAYWFNRINFDRRKISPTESHTARVRARDPASLFVEKIKITAEGYNISVSRMLSFLTKETERGPEVQVALTNIFNHLLVFWSGSVPKALVNGLLSMEEKGPVKDEVWMALKTIGPDIVTKAMKGLPDSKGACKAVIENITTPVIKEF